MELIGERKGEDEDGGALPLSRYRVRERAGGGEAPLFTCGEAERSRRGKCCSCCCWGGLFPICKLKRSGEKKGFFKNRYKKDFFSKIGVEEKVKTF